MFRDSLCPDSAKGMLAMGAAMVSAVAKDLSEFADVSLVWDDRLPEPPLDRDSRAAITRREIRFGKVSCWATAERTFLRLADEVDAVLVIAPETGGCLEKLVFGLGANLPKLISPSREFVSLVSNKNALASHLTASGFADMPSGLLLSQFLESNSLQASDHFPMVVKPIDGAGSEQVAYAQDRQRLNDLLAGLPGSQALDRLRVEEFIKGTAVSVSVVGNSTAFSRVALAGGREVSLDASLVLRPLRQQFDRVPFGNYVGSINDLNDQQIFRSQSLVARLLRYLPATRGYFGIDLVLSDDGSGFDKVIEVNPRLTMSYLALRKIHSGNLAMEMVRRSNIDLPWQS